MPPDRPRPISRPTKLVVAVVVIGLIGAGAWAAYSEYLLGAWYRSAVKAIERRDFPEALRLLEKYLADRPSDAEVAFLAGRTARRNGDFGKAEQFFKEAERLGWVENALLLERSLLRVHRGGLQAEEGYLKGCIHLGHPDTPLILEVLVPAYGRAFDMGTALGLLNRWEELEPNNPMVYFRRGEIHEQLGNKPEALAAFQRVLEMTPDDADAHQKCGELLLQRQSANEALPHFEWLAQHRPPSRAVKLGLARCKIGLSQSDEGRRLLDELLAETPKDAEVLAAYGRLELSAGNAQAAVVRLSQARDLFPDEPELLYTLFQALQRVGRQEEASKVLAHKEEVDNDLRHLTELKQLAASRPDDPAPRHEAGVLLIRYGFKEAGIGWLKTALRVDPAYVPTHLALANYYEEAGDHGRAEAHRELAKQYTAKNRASKSTVANP